MSKNIWVEFDKKFSPEWWNGFSTTEDINKKGINGIKAFFHQKFVEAFEEVERKSFKDKEYSNFRIIGDETLNEIKEKYN